MLNNLTTKRSILVMNGLELRKALQTRRRVYGTLVVSPSPHWPAAVQAAGLDFVFIDTEHIAQDRKELAWMCQNYQAVEIAPIVRIPTPDPYQASMALDGGAAGVVAPYVETVEEVYKLVGAVKYSPLKGRKLNNILTKTSPPERKLERYLQNHNEEKSLIVNIESLPAIEALEDILAVEGLDAILVGPHDLSCSLGIPEDYTNPSFLDAIEQIIHKAYEQNISVGIHVFFPDLDQEIRWIQAGANFVLHSGDILLFKNALQREITSLRTSAGDAKEAEGERQIIV
jgi:4-hydroxy-2-oxoheptanedioate aldolase